MLSSLKMIDVAAVSVVAVAPVIIAVADAIGVTGEGAVNATATGAISICMIYLLTKLFPKMLQSHREERHASLEAMKELCDEIKQDRAEHAKRYEKIADTIAKLPCNQDANENCQSR